MKFVSIAPLVALCVAAPLAAAPAPRPRSKLIVAIAVDQFAADLFDSYRPYFTRGFKRVSSGTVFRNGYQSHAATETCPGHSTILTGAHPARSGIIANNWFDAALAGEKKIYCVEDERSRPAPIAGKTGYTVSAMHLKVPTLGDRMKAVDPASRVVSVSGKDRAAVMLGGHAADQVWWWGGKDFVSNLTARPAVSVGRVNAAIAAALSQPRADLVPPPVCAAKGGPLDIPGDRDLNVVRFGRAAGDTTAFRISPEIDGATLALAASLAGELGLGKHSATDLLAVSLSATDYIGHAYGSGGVEQCLNLMSLDRDLGDFLGVLDGLGVDYQVMLTADHGILDVPERGHRPGAERLDPALTLAAVNADISARLGPGQPALIGDGIGDLYLDRRLAPAVRTRVLNEAARFLATQPQVFGVFNTSDLARMPVPTGDPSRWTVPQRVRASFDAQRSGDLTVILKEQVTPIAVPGPAYAATHGSPWNYDRRVPILFWRQGAAADERPEAADTVDILPTLASMIGLPVPAREIDGKCLKVAGSSCAGK